MYLESSSYFCCDALREDSPMRRGNWLEERERGGFISPSYRHQLGGEEGIPFSEWQRFLVENRKEQGLIPVELRLDEFAQTIIPGTPAGEADFDTEFLDYILAVKCVDDTAEAIVHIAQHSTGHIPMWQQRSISWCSLCRPAFACLKKYHKPPQRKLCGDSFIPSLPPLEAVPAPRSGWNSQNRYR